MIFDDHLFPEFFTPVDDDRSYEVGGDTVLGVFHIDDSEEEDILFVLYFEGFDILFGDIWAVFGVNQEGVYYDEGEVGELYGL